MAFRNFMGGGGGGGGGGQQTQSQPSNSWFGAAQSPRLQPPSDGPTGTNPLNRSDSSSSLQPPQRATSSGGTTAAGIQFAIPGIPASFPVLTERSAQELSRLLHDEEAYRKLLASLDHVKQLSQVRDELKRGNVELARRNLAKESEIGQLRTQCRIIRGTELAAARERLEEMQRREREINMQCSPTVLINRLQAAAQEADNESEELHEKLLAGEIEPGEFMQKFRKLRMSYHRRMQTRLAALASLTHPG